MKKFTASILAIIIVLSCSITAFAGGRDDVDSKINTAVNFAFEDNYGKDGYDASEAKYLLLHAKSGKDVTAYKKQFMQDVQPADGADICTLGIYIQLLTAMGEDTAEAAKRFKETSPENNGGNPFAYFYATEAAKALGEDEFGKSICDYITSTYYGFGEGTDFWGGNGCSPDDLSAFILALAPYKADYKEYIDDAFSLLETYNSDTGYGYAGEGNADSTAMALAAYSAVGNKKLADKAYEKLSSFYNAATGGFTSDFDEYYATADAVFGMEYYVKTFEARSNNGVIIAVAVVAAAAVIIFAATRKKRK